MQIKVNKKLDKSKIISDITKQTCGISPSNIKEYLMEDCQSNGLPVDEQYKSMEKVVIMDCDGVITDGRSYYSDLGKEYKSYGSYDKEMISFLSEYNWHFIFVTNDIEGYKITKSRIEHLQETNSNIHGLMWANSYDRYSFIQKIKNEKLYEFIVFIGDSISDISSLLSADISATTKNAPDEVKKFCNLVSKKEGGHGAVGDILYYIHTHNGKV